QRKLESWPGHAPRELRSRRSRAYSPVGQCQCRLVSPADLLSPAGAGRVALKLLPEKAYAAPFIKCWPVNRDLLCCPAAIDDQGRAGHKGCFVRGEVERGMCNLVRSPHTSDGLASMELPAHLVLVAGEMARQVVFHKRRLHRAGADGVAANPLRGE